MSHRITIVTAGHLATCPRMLKAADAFAGAGYSVRLLSTRFLDWAAEADQDIVQRRSGRWHWTVLDYRRRSAPSTALWSSTRQRAARALSHGFRPARCPFPIAARATLRLFPELLRTLMAEPGDLIYSGGGATAVAFAAARRLSLPFAADLEDFHGAQSDDPEGQWNDLLVQGIEARALHDAVFLTAGSAPIARQYEQTRKVRPIPIHNVFPLPPAPPEIAPPPRREMRCYWFSQTIGPGRGLEEAIHAIGLAGIPAVLDLRGRILPGYDGALHALAAAVAPELKIQFLPPAPPDTMVELAAHHDIGLSLEQPDILNHNLCLSNKTFTYMLAGLAVVFTDTTAQRRLAEDLGPAAVRYSAGRPDQLAAGLRRWWDHPEQLLAARHAAWAAAVRRWHWEHPLECGRLLAAADAALAQRP